MFGVLYLHLLSFCMQCNPQWRLVFLLTVRIPLQKNKKFPSVLFTFLSESYCCFTGSSCPHPRLSLNFYFSASSIPYFSLCNVISFYLFIFFLGPQAFLFSAVSSLGTALLFGWHKFQITVQYLAFSAWHSWGQCIKLVFVIYLNISNEDCP